jgi:hypothetical protein
MTDESVALRRVIEDIGNGELARGLPQVEPAMRERIARQIAWGVLQRLADLDIKVSRDAVA